jgi:hypothetical protein
MRANRALGSSVVAASGSLTFRLLTPRRSVSPEGSIQRRGARMGGKRLGPPSRGARKLMVTMETAASGQFVILPSYPIVGALNVDLFDRKWRRSSPPAEIDVHGHRWFYSPEWQTGETRVDEHIRAGRIQRYPSVDSFLAHLHRRVAERERGGS